MTYYDISPLIHEGTAVFPGDTPFQRQKLMSFEQKHHLELSSLTTTVHIGAHADAPCHYHPDGLGISQRDLALYMGPCQVLDVCTKRRTQQQGRVQMDEIDWTMVRAPRVLFRTDSFLDPDCWKEDFRSLSPEVIKRLAAQSVRLVGIDTPSVDPADSKNLESHHAIYLNDLAILEGLILKDVPAGDYYLLALPLKIKDADASPVRAVLMPANWSRHDLLEHR